MLDNAPRQIRLWLLYGWSTIAAGLFYQIGYEHKLVFYTLFPVAAAISLNYGLRFHFSTDEEILNKNKI
jgi:hypothetical protein